MSRLLLLFSAAAFVLAVAGLTALPMSSPTAHAQPSVCLNLAPGEHTFTAPARDREGDVTFQVSVGEGGVVTALVEPGGQSIPPVAMLDIFAGEDAYPLPEGVAIVECERPGGSLAAGDERAGELCLNLEPGSYVESVSASGQTYDITINVGENSRLTSVEVLGESYSPSDALALLAQFGASIPPHIQILPCETGLADYPTTGTGGLADSNSFTGVWAALATVASLGLVSAIAVRRRVTQPTNETR